MPEFRVILYWSLMSAWGMGDLSRLDCAALAGLEPRDPPASALVSSGIKGVFHRLSFTLHALGALAMHNANAALPLTRLPLPPPKYFSSVLSQVFCYSGK